MRSDEELKQSYKIHIDNEIIHIHIIYDLADSNENTRRMELIREKLFNIFNMDKNKQYKIIVEILYIARGHISNEARKIWIELAKNKQVVKSAVVGQNIFLQVAANFIINTAGRNESIHWFTEKKKALEWLKE